ncbi:acyl-CoA dehydrogenase [soil metagenome]
MLDELALPGSGAGATLGRWRAMAQLAREDLSLARLAEGHADTRAVLAELGRGDLLERPGSDGRLGVWAAEPHLLRAEPTDTGWCLDGTKAWCSGSLALDAALVAATAPDGPRLFLLSPAEPSITAVGGSWEPLGMEPTRSETLRFHMVALAPDAAVGEPAAYVMRPGFGHGGAGVAACWWGGAVGVVDALQRAVAAGADDDVAAALGSAAADLAAAWSCLVEAATDIDERPLDLALANRIANRVRLAVGETVRRALHLTVEALGAAGLCHDPRHAGRVADLIVYLSMLRRRSSEVAYGRAVADCWTELAW